MNVRRLRGGVCPDIDRFQRDKNDPSVIVFREIKRCQHPHSTQNFSKSKKRLHDRVKAHPACSNLAGILVFLPEDTSAARV